ncbi:WxL protein peptidoglycan domain-containing protein [Thermotoga neapolitana]|uniref:Uncharacterized protein n=2 Tax=Thermotoga TaxID=2335 RepID=B9KAX5_THENN|nr:DUF916 domain-containing protein [Thermotoga neapolitana]ACM24108.1 Putative uncharacterized protein precursor [Thermotoga neapolitana DSM 4359]AJG40130.1 hypothetical protein TRQ7_01405 [Thermotoga sp. RQ7]KFZ20897.1 hypothetical protein LA10_10279 [Thermotoga neapolitana LA10]HBF11131.1 DUF916 domain-containing protein [Thermotoga neapolitana]
MKKQKGERDMKRSVLTFLFFLFVSSTFLALNVYPLVNWLDMKPGEEKTFSIRLTAGNSQETVGIEIKDFAIKAGSYVYDLPDYPYSLREYISVPSTEITLAPGEVRNLPITVKIPEDFTGAQAFGSIMFTASSGRRGNIIFTLKIAVLVLVNVENPKILNLSVEDVSFFDLTSPECPPEYRNRYGDFGTVMKLKVKNEGNLVCALNGELRVVSREIGRIVSSIPLSGDEFVIFPDLEEEFTLYTEKIMPSGKVSLQIEGMSQGVRVAASHDVTLPERKITKKAIALKPDLIVFDASQPVNQKLQIQNLTPERLTLNFSTEDPITVLPKRFILPPYAESNLYVRYNPRDIDKLEKGDNIFFLKPSEDVSLVGRGAIVLRNETVEPSYRITMTDYATETQQATLLVENTGRMIMEFSVVEKTALETKTLVEPFVLLPGEKKIVSFTHLLPIGMAKNAVLLRSRIYNTETWKEEKLKWKE